MLPGSVTVTLKTPPPDSFSIGICCGRPSVVPKKVADDAVRLVQNTWKVTDVPGVAVDGSAVADAPGELLAVRVAAAAGPAEASAPAPSSAVPARTGPVRPSQTEPAKRPNRRMYVPPPKTA